MTTSKIMSLNSSWIPTVQYIYHSKGSSEVGRYSPFELTLGSMASLYAKLGEGGLPDNPHARLEHVNSNLKALQ